MSHSLSWHSEFTFGKYRGLTVEEVASFNPEYLAWAVKALDHFDLDQDARRLGQLCLNEHREQSRRRQDAWAWGFGSGAKRAGERWRSEIIAREHRARVAAKARSSSKGSVG